MASCVAQIRAAGSSAATPTRRVALRARNAGEQWSARVGQTLDP
jgi:hypothetical protein